MKLLIAGTRDADLINDPIATAEGDQGNIGRIIFHTIGWKVKTVEEVVHGDSGIIDISGGMWGALFGKKVTSFPANWDLYGKRAGSKRNKQMAEYADELLAVWDMRSSGTRDMIYAMLNQGKPVHIYPVKRYEGTSND
jgi:glycerophosphoryl diester phosphodiesterase